MQITVAVTDANNIVCTVVPPQTQTITIDRGVAGNGIVSIVPVTISTFQYLRITYTNGTVSDVGPLTSTAYTSTSPISIVGNTISLLTVPIASGGTAATTAAAAIQNLLPSYTGNGSKRLGLNSGATALEWVADGGGTVTSVALSGGTTGLTTSGGPITTAGTITLAGTLAIANGGSGQTTAQLAMNAFAGAVTSGSYLRGNGTNVVMATIQAADVPTLNQNTTGTAANITATSNSTLTTLSALSLPGSQVSGNISGNAANVTGTVAIGNGGTGQTTAAAAITALTGTQTSAYYLRSNGTNATLSALSAADLTGAVSIATGGTGQTTANAAFNALAPSQTGNSGKYLTTDGTNTSWATNPLGTVTSVSGTGTVSGLTLSGTVTTSGSLTLGGTLDLSAYNGAGAFTTLSASSTVTLSGGTANGVAYLNGSKVLTTGSALTFDGTTLTNTASGSSALATTGKSLVFYNASTSDALLRAADDASTVTAIGFNKTDVKFYSSGSEQMRLTSTGLGIGTSSPVVKLDVVGAAQFKKSGSIAISGLQSIFSDTGANNSRMTVGVTNSVAAFIAGGSSANPPFVWYTNDGTQENMRLTDSGNLGLGVTPSAWASSYKAFDINSSSSLAAYSSGMSMFQNCYWNGTNFIYKTTATATAMSTDSGTFYWRIAPSGTAGNAITFTQALTLNASGQLLIGGTSAGSYGANIVQTLSAGTVWSVGPITGNTTKWYVLNGSGTGVYLADGSTAWTANSDERLKDIIEPITDAANKVSTLRAVIGKYKTDAQGTRRSFLIAQDVQAVLPEAVDASNPEKLGVQYSEVIPLLVAAINELKTEFDAYKVSHP
ncbi:Intramolecular chaperone auto-processing domain containing protein [uncultured Caudovirales phage]|uniref:Intramolecular chaperone auto-processing domain containing protein n=1 Tax=uncultured Caudovirales phage TaxID=2100421 RepID=A0A6J5MNS0_9CAUD|nr:Intramolecular chaperone auto-processing domain containing protein [uncultured Caudovirales phage]